MCLLGSLFPGLHLLPFTSYVTLEILKRLFLAEGCLLQGRNFFLKIAPRLALRKPFPLFFHAVFIVGALNLELARQQVIKLSNR